MGRRVDDPQGHPALHRDRELAARDDGPLRDHLLTHAGYQLGDPLPPVARRAIAVALPDVVRKRRPAPPPKPEGGRLGLSADFLIAPDGRVLARHHGTHVYDQWSVDELLNLLPVRENRR